jgi:hypothetical protein
MAAIAGASAGWASATVKSAGSVIAKSYLNFCQDARLVGAFAAKLLRYAQAVRSEPHCTKVDAERRAGASLVRLV